MKGAGASFFGLESLGAGFAKFLIVCALAALILTQFAAQLPTNSAAANNTTFALAYIWSLVGWAPLLILVVVAVIVLKATGKLG